MARMKQRLAFLRCRDGAKLPGLFARALLAIAGAAGLSLCVVSTYGLPLSLWQGVLATVVSCLFFLVVLTSKKVGLLATGLFCAAALFALANTALLHRLARSFVYLYNTVLLRLDSGRLPSAQFLTIAASEVETNADMGFPAAMIVLVFLSFLSALFLYGRVRLLPFGVIACLLMALPFVADRIPAMWQWGLLLAAMVGAYAVGACRKAAKPYRATDASVKTGQHRRYGAPGMLAALLCAVAVAISSALVPDGTHFAREDLYARAEELALRIGDRLGKVVEQGVSFDNLAQMLRQDSYGEVMGFRAGGRISIAAPRLTDREILQIDTDVQGPVFLRAGVGASFDGSAWEPPSLPPELAEYPGYLQTLELSRLGLPVPVDFRMGEATLTYLAPTDAFFLPVLAEGEWPADAKAADDGAAVLSSMQMPEPYHAELYAPQHGENGFRDYKDYVQTYREEMEGREAEGGIFLSPAYDAYVREQYLGVPAWLLPELQALAASLTEGHNGDYAKAAAICAYLYENYAYSLEPQKSARGLDDLRCFLFESRQGHCALYASSMALLLRAEGIPTRYATGFAARTSGNAAETLRERDYHAWVEVYFEGVGWLPFDPTGIAAPPDPMPETASPVVTTPPPAETTIPNPASSLSPAETTISSIPEQSQSRFSAWMLLLPLLLLALAAGGILGLRRLHREERKSRTLRTRGNPGRAAALLYGDILLLLAVEGLVPRPGELFGDFARRADAAVPLKETSLVALSELFERREFGRGSVTEEERTGILTYRDALAAMVSGKRTPWSRLWLRLRLLRKNAG